MGGAVFPGHEGHLAGETVPEAVEADFLFALLGAGTCGELSVAFVGGLAGLGDVGCWRHVCGCPLLG